MGIKLLDRGTHIIAGEYPKSSVRIEPLPPTFTVELSSVLSGAQFDTLASDQRQFVIPLGFIVIQSDR